MYSAGEVGHLAGVAGDRIGQWARWGHIRASVFAGEPHVYGWDDVAEAIAVHELLRAGLTLPAVRRAVDALGGPAAWPLSRSGLHVVHGRVAVPRGRELVDLLSGDQEVLPLDGALDPAGLLRGGGWPARERGLSRIAVDPHRLRGRPRLEGTRIAAEEADEELGLEPAAVEEARRWQSSAPARPAQPFTRSRPRAAGRGRGPLVLDGGLPPALAGELRARGREAVSVAELGLGDASDAEVLAAVAERGGVLVTTHDLGAPPVAIVTVTGPALRRDAVHRHAAAVAAQRAGVRRYA